ncbi:MAG TPA: HAD family hydrolase, partial [Lactobacillus sp.]|nr:HAD family hydrolase [Lactobacillus sp.]
DGTLVDTEAIYLQSNVRAAAELGLKRTEDDFRPLVGSAGPNEAKIIADLVGSENAAWFQEFSTKDVLDRIRNGADFVLPGADEALRTLQAARYRLALATSSAQHYVDVVLAAAGWQDWFDPILTGSDVKAHKPDPEVYQVIKRHLGADPAIVIEDTHVGVAAAEGAGLPVIMIPGIAQQPEEKATAILSYITELPDWLQKHATFA